MRYIHHSKDEPFDFYTFIFVTESGVGYNARFTLQDMAELFTYLSYIPEIKPPINRESSFDVEKSSMRTIPSDLIDELSRRLKLCEIRLDKNNEEKLKSWVQEIIENRDERMFNLQRRIAVLESKTIPLYRSELYDLKERVKELERNKWKNLMK
jgi:hypothetical protein